MQLAAQSLERCYSRSFEYTVNGTVMNNGSTMQTPNLLYKITFAIPDNQDYTLTAVRIAAPQTSGSQCTVFTLSSSGAQAAQDNHGNNATKACLGLELIEAAPGRNWPSRSRGGRTQEC
jgi:Tfp pilus assembly protein PilE